MNTISISSGYSIYFLFLIITLLFSTQEMSHATDTINTSQVLKDNGTTLISSGGSFEFGFFSPENSKKRYVGIWYKKIPVRTVIWVANRNNPLPDRSGALKVVKPGRLVLSDGANGIIWAVNATSSMQDPIARLLDSGNLIVKDADDYNPENFLWQSFNYPADTFLPWMKLGWSHVTGHEVFLSSWKSRDDPAPGDFTYRFDPTGYPQNVIKKGALVLYRTENPELKQNSIFTYEMVINKNEVYYHYEPLNESVITRFTLSESGVGQTWIWIDGLLEWIIYQNIPDDNCDIYNACGPYGSCNIENSPFCGCLNKFKPKDLKVWTGEIGRTCSIYLKQVLVWK